MLSGIHVHIRFEPVESIHVVIQSLVLPQLVDKPRVGVYEPPPLPHIHERLLKRQLVLLHNVGDDERGGPGYSEMAVHQHVSLLQSFVDESVGHWEVGQEMGLRSVVGPNEESADVGIRERGFWKPVGFDREHMGDVKASEDIFVCCRSCIAEVEARDYLAVASLCAKVDFMVYSPSGPILKARERHNGVRNAEESNNEGTSQHNK